MSAGRGDCPRAIDVHVHAVPWALVERTAAGEFASVEVASAERGPVFRFPNSDPAPPVPAMMLDPGALAAAGAGQHVALQLLSPWTNLFGYTLGEREAVRWTRAYNSELAELCAASSRRVAMATIPVTYPRAAAEELAHARELGCRGAMIGTDVPGLHLGSPELDPIWAAAAELRMPIMVHPTSLFVPDELREAGLWNTVGRPIKTTVALTKLIYSGALLRHPDLQVVVCHGGGGLPSALPRVIRNHELGWAGSDADVRESVARLHFDSVVLDPDLLRYLVDRFGADRFLMASDLPFPWEPRALETVERALDAEADRVRVLRANAERLYEVSAEAACDSCTAASGPDPSPSPA